MPVISGRVFTLQSELWATNTGIVQGPEGALLVDPGIFPGEYEAIASAVGPIAAGFVTHSHWDHVLWHALLGAETPRFASAETIAMIQNDKEQILRNLTMAEDELNRGTLWQRDLLFHEQPLEWGSGTIAGINVELIPVPGHADGQAALLLPDDRVCFVADNLSDVEVPSVHNGSRSIAVYVQTLDRFQALFDRADWFIPGHGAPADRQEIQRRLDADRRYLTSIGPLVNAASEEEGAEDLARRILNDMGETRGESPLAWSMHLENVEQLIAEREYIANPERTRQSARLIVMDGEHRVWLLRINDPARPRWILPGGGLEAGETSADAAKRELWEECAIDDTPVGQLVGVRERIQSHEGSKYLAQEEYFLVRLNQQQPTITNMFDYETTDYTQQGWFSADDIRASVEQVYPIGLADLIDRIAAGDIPAAPIVFED